jgi:hypothetical protein
MTEFGRKVGRFVKQRYMLSVMCGRSTYKLTWEEIVALYRLTLDQPARNTQARYNVCPTTTIDTMVSEDGKRLLVPMRWGLVPSWWSKPLKELKLATFNARAETVAEPWGHTLADVRCGAHYGLMSDIARGPKRAMSRHGRGATIRPHPVQQCD